MISQLALAAMVLGGSGCGAASTVWFGMSPDRGHRLEIVERGDHDQRVVLDGVEGPSFLGVGVEAVTWSHDGARVAYAARSAAGWSVVVDGGAGALRGPSGAAFDGIGPIVWSPDDRRLAYAAARGPKWVVVEGGVEGLPWDAILARSLVYSPNSARFAYVAADESADEDAPHVRAVIDGVAEPAASGIGDLRFSADGRHYAYLRRDGERSSLVLDGVASAPYAGIASYSIDDDASVVALVVKVEDQWRARIGDDLGPPFERVTSIALTKDGAHTLYGARFGAGDAPAGPRELVVHDLVEGKPYDAIRPTSLRLAEDGRYAYAARAPAGWTVVRGAPGGEKELGWFRAVGDPVLVAHSVLFSAKSDVGSFVVKDGVTQGTYAAVGEIVASSSGGHFAHVARMGSQMLVVRDGAEIPVDLVLEGTLAWSRDGERLGCIVGDAAARNLSFWIDGEARPFDQEELAAALMKRPEAERLEARVDADLLRAWVAAELER